MLPKRYYAPFAQSKYLLRALGFEFLNALFRSSAACEQPKAILRRSRWIALSRCAVHIVPCAVFGFLIPLNYTAIFLGPGFSRARPDGFYLAFFQIAAKSLELVCVASLTTVVLHILRHEMMGDGVPFGFVGSGIFFSQASCFWGPEMLVGASHCVRSWKRMRLLLAIIVAGLLAVFIAPAAAVLLQPRFQNTPAGGTDYFLPVTPDELWPNVINGEDELSACFDEADARHIVCASGGFESLRTYFKAFNSSMYEPLMVLSFDQLKGIVIESAAARIPRLLSSGITVGRNRDTSMTQPNAITAILQESLTQDWNDLARNTKFGSGIIAAKNYKYAPQRVSSTSTTIPVVQVRCARAQNISSDQHSIDFPVKRWVKRILTSSEKGSGIWQDDPMLFNISKTASLHGSNDLETSWVSLPTDKFGPVSGGVYLQFPKEPTTKSRAAIGCSISATWNQASIASDSLAHEAAWYVDKYDIPSIRIDLNASSPHADKYQRLITLEERWYRSLAPLTPREKSDDEFQQFNTLERLFSDVGISADLVAQRTQPQFTYDGSSCVFTSANSTGYTDVDRLNSGTCSYGGSHVLIEMILASIFANGLSHYGSRRAFNLTASHSETNPFTWKLNKPPWAPNHEKALLSSKPTHSAVLPAPLHSGFVTLRMRCEVVGWAWYASSITDYLATAVVAVYMLIALTYTVWVLCTGVTSSSWDTVTELLALALQSPVSEVLRGSGAGVERLGTYKRLVKLRARAEGGEEIAGQGGKVVLIIGDRSNSPREKQETASYRKVKIDEKYS